MLGSNGTQVTIPIYSCIVIEDGDCIYPELYRDGKDSYDRDGRIEYINKDGKIIWKSKNNDAKNYHSTPPIIKMETNVAIAQFRCLL